MHSILGFRCFPSIVKLCFRHSKEVFRCDSSFEHSKHMSVILVYYRNCYVCCNLFVVQSRCAWCVCLLSTVVKNKSKDERRSN